MRSDGAALHLSPYVLGDRNAARFGDSLESRRDVDAVAIDIFTFDDDIADVDPDPKLDRIGLGATGITVLAELSLDFDCAGDAPSLTALANSTSAPSPMSLTIRPRMGGNRRDRSTHARQDGVQT